MGVPMGAPSSTPAPCGITPRAVSAAALLHFITREIIHSLSPPGDGRGLEPGFCPDLGDGEALGHPQTQGIKRAGSTPCAGFFSPYTLLPVWLFPVLDLGSCAVGSWFSWLIQGTEQVPAWDPLGAAQTTRQLHLGLLQTLPLHKQPPKNTLW